MNQTTTVNMLNKGTVFFGTVPDMLTDYNYNEDDQEYVIDCGVNQVSIPKNGMIYFYKSPYNNQYVMSFLPGTANKIVEFILYYNDEIDEMIDFEQTNLVDNRSIRKANIAQLPRIGCSIDVQNMKEEEVGL